jgi:biopolymer transport protein ExbD
MTRLVVVLALLAGCEKPQPAAHAPPAPSPDAAPAATRPAEAPLVVVEPDRIVLGGGVVPDRGGDVDRAAVEAALRARTGEISLGVAPDAPYQRVVDVIDIAGGLGLVVALDVGPGGPQRAGRDQAPVVPDQPMLVIAVSTDAIYLGADQVTTLAALPAGDDIPALRDAIGALAEIPDVLALQADKRTPGALLVRVIGTARRAGVGEVLFAVAMIDRTPPLPGKRAAGP